MVRDGARAERAVRKGDERMRSGRGAACRQVSDTFLVFEDSELTLDSLADRRMNKSAEAEPPRLLDDLFRKTKTTPCIYWLPLTPEQVRRAGDDD